MNKLYAIVTLILLNVVGVAGQQPMKFGHINSTEILSVMPELKQVEATLEAEYKEKEGQLMVMQEELQAKQTEYQQTASAMTPQERAQKEQELGEMGQKVQNYYMLAQQQIQAKENELKAPIMQKLQAAIQEVGAEGGFLYIFELATRVPIYNSEKSIDVAPMVKAKLGIQ
ncbi:OmpH family outer membrane protein [Carboxylicivirga sp. N1Y90]|uniref:OmpH family outer membrane protein n=1 Tax=Carboxylicivirga fragile TaxID=3417571 RepID=UPI003D32CC7F|nr:OmpH family outer membrane protein [Marinilabiliaceae bacterium N1Y90]